MRPFELIAPETVEAAVASPGTFLAGGTTLVDLMKLNVLTPHQVLDINAVPLRGIDTADGLRIGALERMSDIAGHPGVYPAISRALLLSASQQIRNMASIGGNLMQRTRCSYFRDVAMPCNRRDPGSGCPAISGANRMHAVLGTSDSCVATHASDVAVALVALDARLRLVSATGSRTVELGSFYRQPGETPEVENDLRPGELIAEVVVPRLDWASNSTYVKVRDRQSYEFALCSAAVALHVEDSRIVDARVAVGGVATVPWRLPEVEAALRGAPATVSAFDDAAALAVQNARPLAANGFKTSLLPRTIVRALLELTEGSR
ncbi:xanthine dehydrogenase family protein subunit M [Amycolatopsis sp. BJA-103]|uniref:FAD binding domain-containing protein n=1 Tax=Amycolatopsis sp. BJA-103 TaxID=1911175 RepID=UPI000C78F15B|nr:xanthine dehydrogenase family protein subunit M [Amycolatopsis sp. BJA-103]AUI58891.1 FAD-binding molybdopterin dehydrogenase [Amycolatopsis sp. BJA-103]PNE17657.1 FAD-binding molybdopterin dehydrogenase [Amycolatopsis sp. BJA-103]